MSTIDSVVGCVYARGMKRGDELIRKLREVADPLDQELLDVVLGYEATIDGEWGCCHSAEAIEAGRCEEPDKIQAVQIIAKRYGLEVPA